MSVILPEIGGMKRLHGFSLIAATIFSVPFAWWDYTAIEPGTTTAAGGSTGSLEGSLLFNEAFAPAMPIAIFSFACVAQCFFVALLAIVGDFHFQTIAAARLEPRVTIKAGLAASIACAFVVDVHSSGGALLTWHVCAAAVLILTGVHWLATPSDSEFGFLVGAGGGGGSSVGMREGIPYSHGGYGFDSSVSYGMGGGGLMHQNHQQRVWALKAHEDLLAQFRLVMQHIFSHQESRHLFYFLGKSSSSSSSSSISSTSSVRVVVVVVVVVVASLLLPR